MKRKNFLVAFAIMIAAVGITAGTVYLIVRKPQAVYSYDEVKTENIKEEVKASGQVKSAESVDLSLVIGGKVKSINVDVGNKVTAGQVLLSLDNADLAAQVAQAQAALNRQLAGNTPEYIAQLQAALDKAQNDLAQVGGDAPGAENSKLVRDAYTNLYATLQSVQVALSTSLNAADNILGVDNVSINDSFDDYLSSLNTSVLSDANGKYTIAKDSKNKFDASFNTLNNNSNRSDIDASAKLAVEAINRMKDCLFGVSASLENTPSAGVVTPTVLNNLKTGIQTVRGSLATAYTGLVASQNAIDTARTNYGSLQTVVDRAQAALNDAKNPPREVDVAANRAALELVQANYNKTIMYAPISGVVSKQDAKVGQVVGASVPLISVINEDNYQIDLLVSEADLAKIKVGNKANVTLDSLGESVVFPATVAKINPAAETGSAGVASYKVTVQFDNADDRIKVGLTANTKITTAEKNNVLTLPSQDVVQKSGENFVLLDKGNNQIEEVKVEVGVKSPDNRLEIISGLKVGDKVVGYGSK